jgi:hypothetical protein
VVLPSAAAITVQSRTLAYYATPAAGSRSTRVGQAVDEPLAAAAAAAAAVAAAAGTAVAGGAAVGGALSADREISDATDSVELEIGEHRGEPGADLDSSAAAVRGLAAGVSAADLSEGEVVLPSDADFSAGELVDLLPLHTRGDASLSASRQ